MLLEDLRLDGYVCIVNRFVTYRTRGIGTRVKARVIYGRSFCCTAIGGEQTLEMFSGDFQRLETSMLLRYWWHRKRFGEV